ncbi:MAG: hypothetical protein ACSLE4_11425 [Methyloceanibacter sp.]|uniref:hypothetical protein n=1 Tax=Methyloceanibacter sp. TaxID=1965321 RepID=UPI003EE39EBD
MSHHILTHPFGCLRTLVCVLVLSLAAAVWAPPVAVGQDDTQTEEVQSEDAVSEDAAPEEAPAEDSVIEEDPGEDAATEEVPSEAPAEEPAERAEPAPWNVSEPCENYQHPYQADLCQQWRTAEAAEKTAAASERNLGLSRLLMLIGALATLLLLLMFVPLIMAALAARRAARGGAPVSARSDATREEELRAYLDVDKLEFIETPESEGVVKVKITLRNTGQTPAFKIKSAAQVGIRDVSDEDMLPVMPLPERSSLDAARPRLGRNATAADIVQCDSTSSLADRVMSGDATILVWGFAEYMDVFDRRRKTAFQYLCNAETLDTGLVFKPMVRGDEDG